MLLAIYGIVCLASLWCAYCVGWWIGYGQGYRDGMNAEKRISESARR